ncbi:MAG: 4Fe-4S ferredoxin [Sphaerochaetaceae bacterium]|nr:4Fe-4S ferredoxin [Sphaerochaetaceae bacterium]MDD4220605.1 4Fe-4S ferredoxin [Sphaerochaetaceae bacterium]
MHAARNIALCTKDCVCLFVCPTGATDTETGQIDVTKCIDGCRLCVDACPSHAIFLVYDNYAEKKAKNPHIINALTTLLESKVHQETIARGLSSGEDAKIAKALALSNRILAEDCAREGLYMLPQNRSTRELLLSLKEKGTKKDFPLDAIEQLLDLL